MRGALLKRNEDYKAIISEKMFKSDTYDSLKKIEEDMGVGAFKSVGGMVVGGGSSGWVGGRVADMMTGIGKGADLVTGSATVSASSRISLQAKLDLQV